MTARLFFHMACVSLLSLCCGVARGTPMFYNISMDGSGDDGLEFLFPKSFSTREPVQVSAATRVPEASDTPTLTNTITTTIIRLKDFVLTRVVDFLEENLLIIIVVTSLLIVMVFIICCASAMSQKRKLEAYKVPPQPSKKYAANKTGGQRGSDEFQERPYAVDHVKRVQTQSGASSPKNLRVPSKALIGERGRDVRSSPRQDVRKVREAEEVEKRREEPKHKEQTKRREEVQHTSAAPVCTCHLKKSHH
ncbi:transmembrane protein 119 isoform X2 [Phyllopteryx taeniolatus]|nr:transmembrane protein 119 isoform X2 [Phyllopteryx taeniolatus]